MGVSKGTFYFSLHRYGMEWTVCGRRGFFFCAVFFGRTGICPAYLVFSRSSWGRRRRDLDGEMEVFVRRGERVRKAGGKMK